MKKKSYQLYIYPDIYKKLKLMAVERNIPMGDFITELLEKELKQDKQIKNK